MFTEGSDFIVLDPSRGEWGEPGNAVSAITIEYPFYSLQAFKEMIGPFEKLFLHFWRNNLKPGDEEILNSSALLRLAQPRLGITSLVSTIANKSAQ